MLDMLALKVFPSSGELHYIVQAWTMHAPGRAGGAECL